MDELRIRGWGCHSSAPEAENHWTCNSTLVPVNERDPQASKARDSPCIRDCIAVPRSAQYTRSMRAVHWPSAEWVSRTLPENLKMRLFECVGRLNNWR